MLCTEVEVEEEEEGGGASRRSGEEEGEKEEPRLKVRALPLVAPNPRRGCL